MSEIRMLLDEIRDLKRRLQALETRQEHPGFAASDVARLSVDNTFAGVQTISNTGLHLLDTNASHDLIIAPGSNLTADRTLTLTTGDANRTLTMTGNATVNQDVSTVGSPLFASLSMAAVSDSTNNVQISGTASTTKLHLGQFSNGSYIFNNYYYSGSHLTDDNTKGSSGILFSESEIAFQHASAATNPSRVSDMTIKSNGNVLIGTTTDNGGKLQVDQSSTTAAIPALRLNQADISEGFVDFIGTSAASAAGPISSWTVATIAGYVRCEINGAARWMAFYNDPTS